MKLKKKASFYINSSGYLSISDIKRLQITRKFFSKKALLVDRDGVLNIKNKKHFYVRNISELKNNYKLINKLKKYFRKNKIFCITNQAGISTGDLSIKNLNKINQKIKLECKKKFNIYIRDFFVSPHHYDSNHFDRKPNPGLFIKSSIKHKFILDRTCYIGDDIRDIESAYRANTQCYYVGDEKLKKSQKKKYINILMKNLNELK